MEQQMSDIGTPAVLDTQRLPNTTTSLGNTTTACTKVVVTRILGSKTIGFLKARQ